MKSWNSGSIALSSLTFSGFSFFSATSLHYDVAVICSGKEIVLVYDAPVILCRVRMVSLRRREIHSEGGEDSMWALFLAIPAVL